MALAMATAGANERPVGAVGAQIQHLRDASRCAPSDDPAYRSGIGWPRSTDTAVTAFCGLPSITRSL